MKGSLNTMDYLEPYGFINKIKSHFRKHNTANIQTQYDVYNVRAFDLHIDFTDTGKAYFKYDGVAYETFSIYEVLNYLNKKGDTQVRMVFEGKDKENRFREYCHIIEKIYTNIHFFGGYSEYDFKEVYAFKQNYAYGIIDWYENFK